MSQQSLKDKVMEINNYAPVIIPTLNRFEHFKRCLESLERCTGAEHTEVYVALDFPPSEKYKDGWRKIDSYLHNKELEHNFKQLIVIRRERNYGICGEHANDVELMREMRKSSDRYIYTEDDNEFSPNFLQYANWGLEKFKDDPRVYAVCGFKRVNVDFLANNIYMFQKFAPWGFGGWFEKTDERNKLGTFEKMREKLDSLTITDFFSKDISRYCSLVTMLKKKVVYGDTIFGLLPKDKQWCIYPKVSMVRNYGHDGTGQHGSGTSKTYKMYMENPMDESLFFEPVINGDLFDKRLTKIYSKAYPLSFKYRIWSIYVVLMYKLFGKLISR